MKELILLVSIILISISGKSQEYVPFDLENGQWYCHYVTKGGMFEVNHYPSYAIDSVKFFCSGDTIILDTLYKKLYYEGHSSSQYITSTYISGYYGAIRNDTAKKQVWFINKYYDTISLIYDFNVNTGDSICNQVEYPLPVSFSICGKVISIDSVHYCNKYFKRYNIENQGYTCSIIEGLGSADGLFPVISSTWHSTFDCYAETGNLFCDSCATSTFVRNITLHDISIYPNPTSDKITITADKPITSVQLINIIGERVIYQVGIREINLDVDLPLKRLYFLILEVDGEMITRKVIKY